MLKRSITLGLFLILFSINSFAQNWRYEGNLLPEQHGLRDGNFTGIAVDPEGKIWLAPYYYQTDTLTVKITNAAGTQDSVATNQRASMLFIFNPDGTPASFSPLCFLKDKLGAIVDTVGGERYRDPANPDRISYGYLTLRGLRSDFQGNIILSNSKYLKKIDYRDGSFIAEANVSDYQSSTASGIAVDKLGNVYIHSVFPDNPIIQFDQNLSNPITVYASTPGFSRTNLVSDDGLTMYFPSYTTSEIQVFTRSSVFDSFKYDISLVGPKTESIAFDPQGNIWASGGSFNDFPIEPWQPKIHYKLNPNDPLQAPTDSIVWFDKTYYPNDPMASEYQDGRPRGIAFSNDGKTAYLVQFAMFNEIIVQKFVNDSIIEPELFTGLKSPGAQAKNGEQITIPIQFSASEEHQISSVEFKVNKTIPGATITLNESFAPSDWMMEVNDQDGVISFAAAGTNAFVGQMTVMELTLTVNTLVDLKSKLEIVNVVFNENESIPVELGDLFFEGEKIVVPKLFISEYLEGSSNNKALEIFNASDYPVDLSKVSLKQSNNGNGFDVLPQYTLVLSGEIAPYATYTIVNTGATDVYKSKADLILAANTQPGQSVTNFNGDDAIGLFYEDVLIDLIGDPSSDPGTNWSVAGGAAVGGGATNEFTLVRKQGFTGNPNPLASFGTNLTNSEWLVFPQNYADDLSRHSFRMNTNQVALLFEVNMQTQLMRGTFMPDSRGDEAQLRGSFDGWGSGLKLEPNAEANTVYSGILYNDNYDWINPIMYKFVYVNTIENKINWESGADKAFLVENRRFFEDERTEDGYILIKVKDPAPYFDNIAPDGVFTEPSEVTFRLDARPAYYYLEDHGYLPNSPEETQIDGVWANGPLLNLQNGWEEWGQKLTNRSDLQFFDDGTHGDEVAGDSIFTLTFQFPTGAPKTGPIIFGINGYPNDTYAYVDRILTVEKDQTVDMIIGAFINENGDAVISNYNNYITFENGVLGVSRGNFVGEPIPAFFIPIQSNVVAGDLIQIPIVVGTEDNSVKDLLFFTVYFRFNPEQLEFVNVEFGNQFGINAVSNVDASNESNGTIVFYQGSGDETLVSGVYQIGILTFKVRENASPGLVELSVNNLIGQNLLSVPFLFVPEFGTVMINDKQNTKAIVWPGDTNNDGEVSEIDILPLGMYYGLSGPKRPFESINWEGFETDYWELPAATFADTYGNGLVDINDLNGINQNFGKMIPNPSKKGLNGLSSVSIPIPSVEKGDLVRISLSLGNETNPIEGLLGAAMRIVVPAQALSFSDLIPVGILGTEELLPFIRFNKETAELSLAATRTRLQGGVTGFGNIIDLEFEAIASVPAGLELELVNVVTSTETMINYAPLVGVDVVISTSNENDLALPTDFALYQNYPNPFNPSTQIRFDVPENGRVAIEVFNMLGQKVATLVNKDLSAGTHNVSFDASNYSSGIYLYKMTSGNTSITQKMLLVK